MVHFSFFSLSGPLICFFYVMQVAIGVGFLSPIFESYNFLMCCSVGSGWLKSGRSSATCFKLSSLFRISSMFSFFFSTFVPKNTRRDKKTGHIYFWIFSVLFLYIYIFFFILGFIGLYLPVFLLIFNYRWAVLFSPVLL